MKTNYKIFAGFLVGSLAGLATGVLLAPKSGKETRKDISDKTRELSDQLKETGNKKLEELRENYNKRVETLAGDSKEGIDYIKEKVTMN